MDKCPAETLKACPFAILVLMRRMFTWRQSPENVGAESAAADGHRGASGAVRRRARQPAGGMRPHSELSLLQRHQRHEPPAPQRQRPDVPPRHQHPIERRLDLRLAVCSDDVLPRAGSDWQSELAEMDECMPHYYQDHQSTMGRARKPSCGQRHCSVRAASPMHTLNWNAPTHRSRTTDRMNMELCCDFLSRRLSLYTDVEQRYTFEERYAELLQLSRRRRGSTFGVPPVLTTMRCRVKWTKFRRFFRSTAFPMSICLRRASP